MKNTLKFLAIGAGALIVSCATNPFSGKSTLALVPDSQIFPSSFQEYNKFLTEHKVITGTTDAKRVENVGMKIKAASEKWLNANGYKGYLNGYQWEYKLIDSKEINAWCMPGGKIAFYSGIMPVCKDDAGMATVMGHEVAHALANHGQQRMSAAQLQQIGGGVLDAATSGKSESTRAIFAQAYGIGTEVGGMLPFNRSNESEADKIGLTLMAIAGYNPEESIAFWQRMSASNTAGAPPEFMSTHPSDATRIANLKKLIPGAKAEAAKYGVIFK
ncbi:M48 family metallopeptidase [Flavobacterium sp. TMP13]|uniref:M48 family metallopeptidase n=1 Tax=unclassified Flavobacterium TaxID=196869 RepID=UPI00076D779D|nr:M48 family metallopeptidase [Flavobacterium sp. TAB 87]KVV15265.1 TPR repeat-containing protein YfgC precursor [Flavobacterium sp. TAB 87]